jgi:hypothetical protein
LSQRPWRRIYRQECMYVRKRIGRKRSFCRKHGVAIFILACIGTGLLAFALAKVLSKPESAAALRETQITSDRPELIPNYKPPQNERIVYPYSVISGGVRSREELAANITSDPVIAKHYAGFAVQRARIVRSEEAQFAHVSYRIRNNVYWTAKTIKIPKGETLITDGQSSARARCGNKVSVLPQDPISQEEPPIETFEIPIIAAAEPPPLDLAKLPELELELEPRPNSPLKPYAELELRPNSPLKPHAEPGLRPNPPVKPYFAAQPPRIVPYYNRRPVNVPESGSTLILMIIGLAGFAAVRIMRKK